MSDVDFSVKNVDILLRKYSPLLKKLSFMLYNQYNQVMDYSDAKQEVRLCFWRCLSTYDPNRYRFLTYFYSAFFRMQKRLYYTYQSQIVISRSSNSFFVDDDGESMASNGQVGDERFVDSCSNDLDIRDKLSKQSVEIYDLYMKTLVLGPWSISRELKISRYHAKVRYDKFRNEVAKLITVGI